MRSCAASRTAAHPRSRGENSARGDKIAGAFGSSPLTRGKPAVARNFSIHRRLIPAHAGKTGLTYQPVGVKPAHPRSRGENARKRWDQICKAGSSPLTRGKPFTGVPAVDPLGLIPAHAGKTRSPHPYRHGGRAHPRSRGENAAYVGDVPNDTGSSPLTRGKRPPIRGCRGLRGLIPAHAGKTPCVSTCVSRCPAHPRSRGENTAPTSVMIWTSGSSPLTRGKQNDQPIHWGSEGLIPAHAGKTPQTTP